jgi:hypothetical protein
MVDLKRCVDTDTFAGKAKCVWILKKNINKTTKMSFARRAVPKALTKGCAEGTDQGLCRRH